MRQPALRRRAMKRSRVGGEGKENVLLLQLNNSRLTEGRSFATENKVEKRAVVEDEDFSGRVGEGINTPGRRSKRVR